MASRATPDIDFKALAREIRAQGIAVGMESSRLLEEGKSERASDLSKAASSLGHLASQLEEWRQHQATALHQAAQIVTAQRAELEAFERKDGPDMRPREKILFLRAANITNGTAQQLEQIAQQLDSSNQEVNQ